MASLHSKDYMLIFGSIFKLYFCRSRCGGQWQCKQDPENLDSHTPIRGCNMHKGLPRRGSHKLVLDWSFQWEQKELHVVYMTSLCMQGTFYNME